LAAIILFLTKIPKLTIEEEDDSEMKVLKAPLFIILATLVALFVIFTFSAIVSFNESENEFVFLSLCSLFLLILAGILFGKYNAIKKANRFETKAYPQVFLGMLAIFIYVGVEVTIQSNFGALLKLPEYGGLSDSEIGPYISLYWGSLMIGRWTGAIGAFNLKKSTSFVLTIILPFAALALVLFMNHLGGSSVMEFVKYSICVGLLIVAFFMGQQKPALTLSIFSILGVLAMIIGSLTTGTISIYAYLSGGLFCSIMWPCIFSLATAGLGKYTSQASSFLIMMILGGGIIPPIQGLLADKTNIHFSYVITVFCFAFLAWFSFRVKKVLISEGINYDAINTEGH
jgi:MFS transporter, FHS family, L-fucose permease